LFAGSRDVAPTLDPANKSRDVGTRKERFF
jgi:hypothetical protein